MRLMQVRGHQEEGEAAGKWRRALLTSTQLSTYYVGWTAVARPRGRPAVRPTRAGRTGRCTTPCSRTGRRRRATCAACSASDAAAGDPGVEPHPQVPGVVRHDLAGPDGVEEPRGGHGQQHDRSDHARADGATTRVGVGRPEDRAQGHREGDADERRHHDAVEREDRAALEAQPRRPGGEERKHDVARAPVATGGPAPGLVHEGGGARPPDDRVAEGEHLGGALVGPARAGRDVGRALVEEARRPGLQQPAPGVALVRVRRRQSLMEAQRLTVVVPERPGPVGHEGPDAGRRVLRRPVAVEPVVAEDPARPRHDVHDDDGAHDGDEGAQPVEERAGDGVTRARADEPTGAVLPRDRAEPERDDEPEARPLGGARHAEREARGPAPRAPAAARARSPGAAT